MRGDDIKPNWDHPQQSILLAFMLDPLLLPSLLLLLPLLFTRFSKLHRFVKTPWEGCGISRNVMPCLYAAQTAGGRAELSLRGGGSLDAQRLGLGARFAPNTTCQAK